MKTTFFVRQGNFVHIGLWAAALVCLGAVGCFSSLNPSDLQCSKSEGCPSNYICSATGTCVPGTSHSDGSPDLPSGSGGTTSLLDGPIATGGNGGTTSTSDGPSGAGETTSTPDAPIFNDASDAPTALTNGSLCTTDDQCSNNSCVDGHCCDGKCAGNCESCVTGTCSFTSTPRKACNGSDKCAGTCDKANTQACTYPDSSTVCGAQSCSGVQRTNKSVCDGLGNCPTQTKTTCDSNQCLADGSDCSGTCSAASCGASKYCTGSTCAPLKNQGDSCSDKAECSTGNCADGYCCDSVCTGTCTSCAVTHGKCTNTTSPRAGKSCGGTAPCNASCNGSSPDCVPASTSTPCGSASCLSSTQLQLAGTCNSQGTCSQSTQTCTICLSSTNACADCTPGVDKKCSTGGVPQKCDTSGHWVNDTACGTGQVCSAGSCICSGTTPNACGSVCTNFSTDNSNCGGCGTICTSPKTCGGGGTASQCGCTPDCGTRVCGSVPNGCGTSCGTCSSGSCNTAGQCACPLGGAQSSCGTCLSWDFESGTSLADTNGWVRDTSSSMWCTLTRTTSPTYNSSGHSLAITVSNDLGFEVEVPICNMADLSGLLFTAHILIQDLAGASSLDVTSLLFMPPNEAFFGAGWESSRTVATNTWFPITSTWPNGATGSQYLKLFFQMGNSWSGTVYLDDIVFSN